MVASSELQSASFPGRDPDRPRKPCLLIDSDAFFAAALAFAALKALSAIDLTIVGFFSKYSVIASENNLFTTPSTS